MQGFIDNLIRGWGYDPATWPWTQFVYVAFMGLFSFIVINFAAISGGIFSWAERRIAARMQSRVGPNRVGPAGVLQWLADAVEPLFKEDLIPAGADNVLFRAAPYFMMVGFACLFGAIRSAAQIISYEIPAGMALMIPVLLAGTMSTQGIIRAQGPWPWQWFIFDDPAATAAFFIFFISALAEGNRTPFDLPEAESELVSGYNTEYSGMRFSYFFLVEWGNMWVMSALAVTMFLGGWQIPGLSVERFDALTGGMGVVAEVASLLIFALKTLFFVFVVMWLRWTLPRIRVDQMMNMCWKYLVPASFTGVLFVAAWMLLVNAQPWLGYAMRFTLTAVGALAIAMFAVRVLRNIRDTGDKFDFTSNW